MELFYDLEFLDEIYSYIKYAEKVDVKNILI